jgi:transposase
MAEHIYPKRIKGKVYYYLQRTWREKTPSDNPDKTKGSGKSRVRTQSIYLGTASSILQRLKNTPSPLEVHHRDFGFVSAIYQTAVDIGLVELLKESIPGSRFGVPKWLYFMLPIINRLQEATSKQRMGSWSASTVLPDLLDFDSNSLNSQSFWYATDDIISEKLLKQRRQQNPKLEEDLFTGLDDSVFRCIEEKLFLNLRKLLDLSWEVFLYDTTHFFTYLEEPLCSKLAKSGHNKEGQHQKKQVGLALCVDKEFGLPLFHRVYRGNSNDSKTFSSVIDDLLSHIQQGFQQIDNLVLVLDKGNNSEDNFKHLQGKLKWVGSLILSYFPDLVDLPLEAYPGRFEQYQYYPCQRQVMGVECQLVLTYHDKLARKQQHGLSQGIDKLKHQIEAKWASYKRRPKRVPAGVKGLIKDSTYGKYLSVRCKSGQPLFQETAAVAEKQKYFGKHLLFSNQLEATGPWIITQYHSKHKVEEGFKLLKDPGLIRWRPTRHWTDTKIRAFGFCCVMSLVVIRVMEFKVAQAGLLMSPAVLKQELSDLKEVVLVYDEHTVKTQISHRSSIQQKLSELFNLDIWESRLTIHSA